MRFAYADPPYPGLAVKYYSEDERCAEVDHAELVRELVENFPDGWALSTSAEALQHVLKLCPEGVRVCPWIHGGRKTPSKRPRTAWEPLLVYRGRRRSVAVLDDLVDVLVWGGRARSFPGALVGMKPAPFAEWMFRLLGARKGDQLADLFPGSGAVSKAWSIFQANEKRTALPSRHEQAAARINRPEIDGQDEEETVCP